METGDWVTAAKKETAGRFYRTTDRNCEKCETERGSVTVDRWSDTARCDACQNDPETWDDPSPDGV